MGIENKHVTMRDGTSGYRDVYKDGYGNTVDVKSGEVVVPTSKPPPAPPPQSTGGDK